jgi:hypothetical protein
MDKCFRGRECCKAGNFRHWNKVEEVVNDWVLVHLCNKALGVGYGTFSDTVDFTDYIGWSSTAPRGQYSDADLDGFHPNNHSSALRVVDPTKSAPLTKSLTIIGEYRKDGGVEKIIIHSMYPGKYVGVLDGDISEREGVVFFDWEHPGEPWRRT